MDSTFFEAADLAPFDSMKGWPESLPPERAIALQCRRRGMGWGGFMSHPDTKELFARMRAAVAAGELQYKEWTEHRMEEVSNPSNLILQRGWEAHDSEWERRERLSGVSVKRKVEVRHRHITPEAFAAWLTASAIEPSRHVAAWFKAHGLDTDSRSQAPKKNETIAARNARWLVVWDEERLPGKRQVGSQARAIKRIAEAEGAKKDTVKKALQSADDARREQYREGGAIPLRGQKNTPQDPFNRTGRFQA